MVIAPSSPASTTIPTRNTTVSATWAWMPNTMMRTTMRTISANTAVYLTSSILLRLRNTLTAFGCDKLVARPAHGEEAGGPGRVLLDLLPEVPHVDVQGLAGPVIVTPD